MLSFDLQGNWADLPLAFLDLETTGLDTGQDRIVEVGIVVYRERRIAERWGVLVDPRRSIPEEAIKTHHITEEMVEGKPVFRDVAWDVYQRLRDRVVVAYNGLSFDIPLLAAEMERCGLTLPLAPALDPMMWVFKKMPSRSGWPFGLVKAADKLGVAYPEAHRAVADCEAMAQVTMRLADHVPPTLGELLDQQATWYDEFMALKAEREAKKAASNPPPEEEPDDGQSGLFGG
jgi:DNA polymerase III subunit epsilon